MNKYFIPIILGTVRQGRESEKVAKFLVRKLEAHPETDTQLFDPREMNLPMDDEGQDMKDKNPEYRDAIIRADGLMVIAPEYNHGYPGSLKRVLDLLLKEYVHKPVGLCGVSAGGFGGARVIENLLPVLRELGLVVSSYDITVSKVASSLDKDGNPQADYLDKAADNLIEDLLWLAKSLRWGRENISNKFHQ